jgi:hypothetical protein
MNAQNYNGSAVAKADGIIKHFNRKWASAVRRFPRVVGETPAIVPDFSWGNSDGNSDTSSLTAAFYAPSRYSPNDVDVALRFFLNYGVNQRHYPPIGGIKEVPKIEDMRNLRLSFNDLSICCDGELDVRRRNALLFKSGFHVASIDCIGETPASYLNPVIEFGKKDQTFLDFYRKELAELVFREKYPVKKAIDLAFKMYARPPQQWLDANPIPHPLSKK